MAERPDPSRAWRHRAVGDDHGDQQPCRAITVPLYLELASRHFDAQALVGDIAMGSIVARGVPRHRQSPSEWGCALRHRWPDRVVAARPRIAKLAARAVRARRRRRDRVRARHGARQRRRASSARSSRSTSAALAVSFTISKLAAPRRPAGDRDRAGAADPRRGARDRRRRASLLRTELTPSAARQRRTAPSCSSSGGPRRLALLIATRSRSASRRTRPAAGSAVEQADVVSCSLRLPPSRRASGSGGGGAVALERLDVGEVLAQDRGGADAVERLAVAGHDHRRLLDERLQAAQRREVAVERRRRRQLGDRARREVVAGTRARRAHGIQIAVPSDGVPVGRVQLQLAVSRREQ